MGTDLQTKTWLIWASAATVALTIAGGPLGVVIILATSSVVFLLSKDSSSNAKVFPMMLGLASAFLAIRVLLAAITAHDSSQILFVLPEVPVPSALGGFTLGGPVNLGILAATARDALLVVGIMAAFACFSVMADHTRLISAFPRPLRPAGLVLSVALCFVPATACAIRGATEAQIARAGPKSRSRAWWPSRSARLVLPVLDQAIVRAVALGETMDSRGFDNNARNRTPATVIGAMAAALVFLLVGVGGAIARNALFTWAGAGLVVGCLTLAFCLARKAERAPRYYPVKFTRADTVVIGCALCALVLLGVAGMLSQFGTGPDSVPVPEGSLALTTRWLKRIAFLLFLTPVVFLIAARPAARNNS